MNGKHYQDALKIAQEAHSGQYRFTGESYINHPLRVAKKQETIRGMILGVLHDVIEDCDEKYEEIIESKYGEKIISGLRLLTHLHDDYQGYIDRLCSSNDRDVLLVKLADVIDNLNMSKWNINLIDDDQIARIDRYSLALKKIYTALKDGKETIKG